MRTRRIQHALCAAGALALAACGDTTQQAPSGRSMSAAPPPQATSADANQPPRVTSLSITPDDPRSGGVVQAVGSAADPEGNPTHLRYSWRVNGETVAANGAALTLPTLPKGARIEVEAVANDGRVDSDPVVASAEVGNRAPEISDVHFDRASELRAGDPIVAVVAAEDPDGDPVHLAYTWSVNGRVVEEDADRLDTKTLKRGDQIAVRVVASDGDDESEGFDTPSLVLGNSAPEITSMPPAGMGADGVYHYAVEASDPDRDHSLRFSLATAPPGAQIDPVGGELTWKPTFQQTGVHPIEVVVADGHGGETKQRFEVTVKEVGGAPPASPAP